MQALDASIKSKRNISSTFNLSARTEVVDGNFKEMAAIKAAASPLLCYVCVIFPHVSHGVCAAPTRARTASWSGLSSAISSSHPDSSLLDNAETSKKS